MSILTALLQAALEVPHVDDDGLGLQPFASGRHATACRFCDAVDMARLLEVADQTGGTR